MNRFTPNINSGRWPDPLAGTGFDPVTGLPGVEQAGALISSVASNLAARASAPALTGPPNLTTGRGVDPRKYDGDPAVRRAAAQQPAQPPTSPTIYATPGAGEPPSLAPQNNVKLNTIEDLAKYNAFRRSEELRESRHQQKLQDQQGARDFNDYRRALNERAAKKVKEGLSPADARAETMEELDAERGTPRPTSRTQAQFVPRPAIGKATRKGKERATEYRMSQDRQRYGSDNAAIARARFEPGNEDPLTLAMRVLATDPSNPEALAIVQKTRTRSQ